MSTSRRAAARRATSLLRRVLPAPRRSEAGEPADRIAVLAQEAGEPVQEVLREVADFRLALETDMLIAAAALDAEEAGLAAGMLDDERAQLSGFRDRLLDRLAEVSYGEAEATPRRQPATSRFRVVSQLVAATAALLIVVVAGSVATHRGGSQPAAATRQVALAEGQLRTLSSAALRDDAPAAQVAARALHDTIQQLITEHGDDPDVAEQLVSLLTNDLALIKAQPELRAVLARAISLAKQLRHRAPAAMRPTAAALVAAATSPSPKPVAKPSPKPSASPSPSPTSSSPSPTPSSSATPDDTGPTLPSAGDSL